MLYKVPLGDSVFFSFFIELMFILKTIIRKMDTKFFLTFHIFFWVVFDSKSTVTCVEESDTRTAIIEKVTSDIEFFVIEKKRSNIVLN